MSFMAQIPRLHQRCVLAFGQAADASVQKELFKVLFLTDIRNVFPFGKPVITSTVMINDIIRRYDKWYKRHHFEDTVNQGTRSHVVTFTRSVEDVLTVLLFSSVIEK
ncbi:unnamed protein product [Arctogadus glacialis]